MIIAENKLHAHHNLLTYNESLQLQTGLPPHRSFAHKDLPFFDDGSIFSFRSDQRFRGPTRSGKARHLSH